MRNKTRYVIDDDDDSNSDDVLADGHALRVRMELMDSGKMREVVTVINARDFQPHFGTASDAETLRRTLARDEMIRRAENGWRTMGRDAAKPEPDDPDEPDEDDIDDNNRATRAYRAMVKRNSNAWRVPIGPGPGGYCESAP